MSLVKLEQNGRGIQQTAPPDAAAVAGFSIDQVWQMAQFVAAGRLFPVSSPEQAVTLMLICQAEGLHPIMALRRYHIIQNRPAMRSDAVQGEMMARGWIIRPVKRDAREARAVFAHPTKNPDGFEMSVCFDQYKHLNSKDNWKNHPDDMLWARLVTKACRTLDPGIIAGIYSPEEIEDMADYSSPSVIRAQAQQEAIEAIRAADVPLPLDPTDRPDSRPYPEVIKDVAAAVGYEAKHVHDHLWNRAVQTDQLETRGGKPPKRTAEIQAIAKLYARDRDWVRRELAKFIELRQEVADEVTVDVTEGDPDGDYPDEPGANG